MAGWLHDGWLAALMVYWLQVGWLAAWQLAGSMIWSTGCMMAGCIMVCWLHDGLLTTRWLTGCMMAGWLHDGWLDAWWSAGCLMECWLHDGMLTVSGWLAALWLDSCIMVGWLHDGMPTAWWYVECMMVGLLHDGWLPALMVTKVAMSLCHLVSGNYCKFDTNYGGHLYSWLFLNMLKACAYAQFFSLYSVILKIQQNIHCLNHWNMLIFA